MGTTLSGLKIKDTYQGLIKLTDNAAASSTTRELTDGVGNDLNIQVDTTGRLEATSFVKTSGTSSQILLADGTVATTLATSYLADDSVTFAKLEDRYTEVESISTLTGTVSFDCSNGAIFKLSGDITGNYTIDLSNYKKGQIISIYPIKGSFTVTLDAQGSSTNTFNKVGGVDYDGASDNYLQIECVDDSSTNPIFFYSIATYASDSTPS